MIRLNRRSKPLVCLGAAALLLFLWRYYRQSEPDWEIIGDEEVGHVIRDPGIKGDKWIIVTTIQNPTESLILLSQVPGWKLLVVGDRKTPKGWRLEGATFLDVRTQKALGYQIHKWLPYDSYTRKAIGYLYAIEHGATYIYETDDDNFPSDGLQSFLLSLGTYTGLMVDTQNLTYNPYVHFGQSTMWPRGYPLENVGLSQPREYKVCEMHVPSIQQGLVNGDPDVDAVFRMTRRNLAEPLKLYFDKVAPPIVLPQGTFAPFNSQNTLFTAKAFWAMILPTSVSMRATDIYRSYWAQRLLWTMGSNLAFCPPNTVQRRNPHSDYMDSIEENELYHYMGQLVNYLSKWKCTKQFFFDCISQLTHDLVQAGFLKNRDSELVNAWITDLSTVGYAPPALKEVHSCHGDSKEVVFYPAEQNTTLPHSTYRHTPIDLTNQEHTRELLTSTCGHEFKSFYDISLQKATQFPDLLLIISLQSMHLNAIPYLEAAYKAKFPHILYCGNANYDKAFLHKWKVSYIKVSDQASASTCLDSAIKLGYSGEAYMHITDNMLLTDKIHSKHKQMMWMSAEFDAYTPEYKSLCKQKVLNCVPMNREILNELRNEIQESGELTMELKNQLQQCFQKIYSDPSFQTGEQIMWISDIAVYLPKRMTGTFQKLFKLYSGKHKKYHFISYLLLECMELTVEYLDFKASQGGATTNNLDYVLPFVFSSVQKSTEQRFCDIFLQYKSK